MAKKKVLLMGKAHSGKTSMRSIIFANYLARDTTRLSPTLDVEHHHVRFLGDLVLNLWDCGGQDAFYESYFERDRETIFRSVELLIYVFDIESDQPEKDFDHFCGVLEAIEENSPDARVFILVHKMDLVAQEDREAIFDDRKRLIEDSCRSCGVENFQCFGTSIWDETLYKAWSEIVTNLIPNIRLLETHLEKFCKMCDADEVVLFERATFLVISQAQAINSVGPNDPDSLLAPPQEVEGDTGGLGEDGASPAIISSSPHLGLSTDPEGLPETTSTGDFPPTEVGGDIDSSNAAIVNSGGNTGLTGSVHTPRHLSRTPHFDAHRFEKISNIVKQFKLSCGKAQSQFQGMQVRNSRFSAFIDAFTANTYIMVIVSNPQVHTAATLLNIQNARNHFEKFIPRI
jgi:Ras-related GTP-binding protein A/B